MKKRDGQKPTDLTISWINMLYSFSSQDRRGDEEGTDVTFGVTKLVPSVIVPIFMRCRGRR